MDYLTNICGLLYLPSLLVTQPAFPKYSGLLLILQGSLAGAKTQSKLQGSAMSLEHYGEQKMELSSLLDTNNVFSSNTYIQLVKDGPKVKLVLHGSISKVKSMDEK